MSAKKRDSLRKLCGELNLNNLNTKRVIYRLRIKLLDAEEMQHLLHQAAKLNRNLKLQGYLNFYYKM